MSGGCGIMGKGAYRVLVGKLREIDHVKTQAWMGRY